MDIGQQFGRWTVIQNTGKRVANGMVYRCRCICGNEKEIAAKYLKQGGSKSCGCLRRENSRALISLCPAKQPTHGLSGTRIYSVWNQMIQRCVNPKAHRFDRYGGRGISVCESWRLFQNFIDDMGMPPLGMSIERKDNDGHYCKDNCVWADSYQQAQNKINNVNLTFDGETHCLSEWARRKGFGVKMLSRRILDGWSVERALCTPSRNRKRNG